MVTVTKKAPPLSEWLIAHVAQLPGGTPFAPKDLVAAVPPEVSDNYATMRSVATTVTSALSANGVLVTRGLVVKDPDSKGLYRRTSVPEGGVPAQRAQAAAKDIKATQLPDHDPMPPLMAAMAAQEEAVLSARKRANAAASDLMDLLDEVGISYTYQKDRDGISLHWKWA